MIKNKNFINLFSLLALFSISLIFLLKYSSRVTDYTSVIIVVYASVFVLALKFIDSKIKNNTADKIVHSFILFLAVFAIASVVVLISPAETRVGRIAALNSWLKNFEMSIFPYRSEVNPSGFPFLFLLASPFYLLGEAGLFSAMGVALLVIQLKSVSNYKKEFFFSVVVLLLLPSTYYELITKSDLLANSALLAIVALLSFKFIKPGSRDIQFFVIAIIAGLFAATRLVSFLILFTIFLFLFRNKLKNGIIFLAVSLSAFILVNLPFLLWDAKYFIERGPLSIQLLYLPMWCYFVFPLLIGYFGWAIVDFQEYFFLNGMTIFLLAVISFISTIIGEGFDSAFYGSRFDISYFILSIPFFLLSLKEYEVDRFLGKIYPLPK